jgi:small subunit ribosomal protein S20
MRRDAVALLVQPIPSHKDESVANHKDAEKRARQALIHRNRNRVWRSRIRNQIKKLRASLEAGHVGEAEAMFPATVGVLQRAAGKGVIHARNAARRISRLARAINQKKAPPSEPAAE